MLQTVFGDLRSVAGHQAVQADSMLPIEAMKSSANTIAGVSYQYELRSSVIRRVKRSGAIDGTHVRMAAIPSENGDFVRWRLGRIKVDQPEKCNGIDEKAQSGHRSVYNHWN